MTTHRSITFSNNFCFERIFTYAMCEQRNVSKQPETTKVGQIKRKRRTCTIVFNDGIGHVRNWKLALKGNKLELVTR
jgi:hypothetical protein